MTKVHRIEPGFMGMSEGDEIKCVVCIGIDGSSYLFPVTDDQAARVAIWAEGGDFIQDILPDLTIEQRELMISGIPTHIWNQMPPEDWGNESDLDWGPDDILDDEDEDQLELPFDPPRKTKH